MSKKVRMPSTTRLQSSMAATRDDVRKIIDEALKPIQEHIAELPEKNWINAKFTEAIDKLEEKFEKKLLDYNNKIENLVRRVDELEGLAKVVEKLDEKIDDSEQYSRRLCLRVNGIPVYKGDPKEDCVEKVHEMFNESGVTIDKDAIDRAHRIGRINNHGKQQIIIRFESFRERTLVYKDRKKCKNAKIVLDLTKRRLNLLLWAKETIKDRDDIDFAFADINCNIGIRMKDGEFFFFRNEQELYDKISKQKQNISS